MSSAAAENKRCRRRQVLQSWVAWGLACGPHWAVAHSDSNVVEFSGAVRLNGLPLHSNQSVQTGDVIETGLHGHLIFVMGQAAFQVRENTALSVMRGATFLTVSELHVTHGGVVSVWAQSTPSRIVTPQVTVNVKAAGIYTEVSEKHRRTYCCNCHGSVHVMTAGEEKASHAEHHQAFWIDAQQHGVDRLDAAPMVKHADQELVFLNQLLHQKSPWPMGVGRAATALPGWTSATTQAFLD